MDKGTPAGWFVHLGVMAGLVVVGILASIFEPPSRGGWISLRGIGAMIVWLGLALYAVASTLTFALLRSKIGVVPAYLVALPLAIAIGAALWWLRVEADRRWLQARDEATLRRLSGRFEFIGWSSVPAGEGPRQLRVEIRALKDLGVRFDAVGSADQRNALDSSPPRDPERRLKAGETGIFEGRLDRATGPSPAEIELRFTTWTGDDPGGVPGTVSYLSDFPAEAVAGDGLLWRPLPPARP